MIESIYAEAFLDSLLKTDATLTGAAALNGPKVYRNRAPQGAAAPFVIYNVQAGDDVLSGNAVRLFSRPLFQVRTVGRVVGTALQDATRVRAAAHRTDELLRGVRRVPYTVEAATFNFNVWRVTELPVREEPGATADEFFRSYGGFYQVEIFQ